MAAPRATHVSFDPSGLAVVTGTDVQTAIAELDAAVAAGGGGAGSLPGAWVAYTPTWSAAVTNPALGNGTIDAAWQEFNKTAFFRIKLTFGSTTTSGSGNWQFSFPTASTQGTIIAASGWAEQGTSRVVLTGRVASVGGLLTPLSTSGLVSGTVPFTWSSGGVLAIAGLYEIP